MDVESMRKDDLRAYANEKGMKLAARNVFAMRAQIYRAMGNEPMAGWEEIRMIKEIRNPATGGNIQLLIPEEFSDKFKWDGEVDARIWEYPSREGMVDSLRELTQESIRLDEEKKMQRMPIYQLSRNANLNYWRDTRQPYPNYSKNIMPKYWMT